MLNEEKSSSAGEEQKDLPKPLTDLPTPEKEITAKTEPKSSIFKSKFFLLFVAICFLIAFLIGGFILGKNNTNKQVACALEAKICPDGSSSVGRTGPNCEFAACPEVTPTLSPSPVDETAQSFLEIPEYGVRFALSDNIKDAYYLPSTADKGYVYLKVHSLDSEPNCNDGSSLGVAALSKVGKDDINEISGKKYSDSGNGVTIGNYYYFIDLEQAVCSQNLSNQTLETNARKAFGDASATIEKL